MVSNAWKACDVRGPYPDDVNEAFFEDLGEKIARTERAGTPMVLGGDFRISTPSLKAALMAGLVRGGAKVIDVGRLATPVAHFARRWTGARGVLVVTASHNPPNDNGLKFMMGDLPPTEADLARLRDAMPGECPDRSGSVICLDPVPAYVRWLRGRWGHLCERRPLRVVIDAGSGAWSEIGPALFDNLGFHVHRLHCEIDGRFPHRDPNSARTANLTALIAHVTEVGADLGVAWDGDGDRVTFTDETGQPLHADQTSLILLRDLLPGRAGARVVYDIKLSDWVRREAEQLGGTAVLERSGHAFLKRRMITESCLLGCEASGHYVHKELGGGDDGLFTALKMCEIVQRHGSLAALRAQLPKLHLTPEIRLPAKVLPFGEIRARLRKNLGAMRELELDGIRFSTPLGTVLARPSVTEPAVTVRAEAESADRLSALVTLCAESLTEFSDEFRLAVEHL